MSVEYEVKILDINPELVRSRLREKSAKLVGIFNFRRYVYELPNKPHNEWLRLRTDGKLTTLTYKNARLDTIDGVDEIEVTINDFDEMANLLCKAGFENKGYQENTRELYILDDTEISIDCWPKIPAFVEIEGKTEHKVRSIIKMLDFEDLKKTSKTTAEIYKDYGLNISDISLKPISN